MNTSAPPLQGVRLLLAEDETLIAMFLSRSLALLGADVTSVASVEEGMECAAEPFDCALLDVSLRDGEVFPLADTLHERGVPLVFHTGHGSAFDRLREYGTPSALEKPAHKSEILTALLACLTRNFSSNGVSSGMSVQP